jgi:hypothetical protein
LWISTPLFESIILFPISDELISILLRYLRIGRGGPLDIKNEWRFLDDLRRLGFDNVHAATISGIKYTQSTVPDTTNSSYTNQNEQHENPVTIVKRRLAKGDISKEEYDELRRAIQS